eukprot:6722855-Alexandrium_andersonii.AAC.1
MARAPGLAGELELLSAQAGGRDEDRVAAQQSGLAPQGLSSSCQSGGWVAGWLGGWLDWWLDETGCGCR